MKILGVLILAVLALMAYIRLAPSVAGRWHVEPRVSENKDMAGGVVRLVAGGSQQMAQLDKLIRATPRTTVLAGGADLGHVTYVTRSALWGFPDYTTVQLQGDQIAILARLRFGKSDMGVNKARVDGWLRALAGLQG